jgi:hypothetical protein
MMAGVLVLHLHQLQSQVHQVHQVRQALRLFQMMDGEAQPHLAMMIGEQLEVPVVLVRRMTTGKKYNRK